MSPADGIDYVSAKSPREVPGITGERRRWRRGWVTFLQSKRVKVQIACRCCWKRLTDMCVFLVSRLISLLCLSDSKVSDHRVDYYYGFVQIMIISSSSSFVSFVFFRPLRIQPKSTGSPFLRCLSLKICPTANRNLPVTPSPISLPENLSRSQSKSTSNSFSDIYI